MSHPRKDSIANMYTSAAFDGRTGHTIAIMEEPQQMHAEGQSGGGPSD